MNIKVKSKGEVLEFDDCTMLDDDGCTLRVMKHVQGLSTFDNPDTYVTIAMFREWTWVIKDVSDD